MALHDIDPKTLMKWIAEDKVIIVDVREPWEYAQERIKNVIHLPMSSFDPKNVPASKDKLVVFYCKGGVRSARAANAWMGLGHDEGYHLAGGLDFWKAEGGDIVSAKSPSISVERQVRMIIGGMFAVSSLFGIYVNPSFHYFTAIMAIAYVLSGVFGFCALEMALTKCQSGGCCSKKGSCSDKDKGDCHTKGSCCDKEHGSCGSKPKKSCSDKDSGGCCGH